LTEVLDMLLNQAYSDAILHPGQTPGSAAGGASPDGTTGAWLGRRARLPEAVNKTAKPPEGIDPRSRSRGSSFFSRDESCAFVPG
jgi:hypothetical protein